MNDLDLEHRRQQVGTSPAVWKTPDLRSDPRRSPATVTGHGQETNEDAQHDGALVGPVLRVILAAALVGSLAGLVQTHIPGFWARNVLVLWPMVLIGVVLAAFGLRSTL